MAGHPSVGPRGDDGGHYWPTIGNELTAAGTPLGSGIRALVKGGMRGSRSCHVLSIVQMCKTNVQDSLKCPHA